jgi:hypothetical protein
VTVSTRAFSARTCGAILYLLARCSAAACRWGMGTHLHARAVVRHKHRESPLPRALRNTICIPLTTAQLVRCGTGDGEGKLLAVGGGGEDDGREGVGEANGGGERCGR